MNCFKLVDVQFFLVLLHNLGEQLYFIFKRLCRKGNKLEDISSKVIKKLAIHNDVVLLPHLLRDHIFSYGLYGKNPRNDCHSLTIEETKQSVESLVEHAQQNLEYYTSYKQAFNVNLLFLINDFYEGKSQFKAIVQKWQSLNDGVLLLCFILFYDSRNIEFNFLMKMFDDLETFLNDIETARSKYQSDTLEYEVLNIGFERLSQSIEQYNNSKNDKVDKQ